MKQIIVIGGGASGMMAAIAAARKGASVTIIEHMDRVGKKLLSTGNGRCNFTNIQQDSSCYRSDSGERPWTIIRKFPAPDVIRFFLELGIYSKNRNGYLYPNSDQASAVLDVLRMELDRLHVNVRLLEEPIALQKNEDGTFLVRTEQRLSKEEQKERARAAKKTKKNEAPAALPTYTYRCDKLILACGGMAASFTGSDGSGYSFAKSFGHRLVSCAPALVPLICKEHWYKQLAGVRAQGRVSLYWEDLPMASDVGEIQLTNYGISGIPVFQVSRYAAKGLMQNRSVWAKLDFAPDFPEDAFLTFLKNRIRLHPERTMETFFTGLFHKSLAQVFLQRCGIDRTITVGALDEASLSSLVQTIKHFSTEVTGTKEMDQAQVTAGGIDVAEVDPATMESTKTKGLYLAGELLDVDGICGGYNLQWAWTTGYLAGKGAAYDPD